MKLTITESITSENFSNIVEKFDIKPRYRFDHSSVVIELRNGDDVDFGS